MQFSTAGKKEHIKRYETTCLTTSMHRSTLQRRAHYLVFNEEEFFSTVLDISCNSSSVWEMFNTGVTKLFLVQFKPFCQS